ncbi:MAG: protein kinase [Polyangiaceae bacterium]|nr:protein kinase [Polyangiaceae bacterium]
MESRPDDLIGAVVAGRYRVLERLGRGGMGTVYLAEHEAIQKRVALKVLHPEYSAKPELVERFQREAISASRIKHVNVLDVFDFGQVENGCFFLAMEFLEGHDLADELEHHGVLSADRAIAITLQICRALAAAHSRGVVHRDLKPENVFLHTTADGEELVKLVDFGIAQLRTPEEAALSERHRRRRLTRTGMIFGTPEYMSTEQAAGKHVDARSDVYATGIMLFEMLSGAVPFTGDTFFAVLSSHLNDPLLSMKQLNPAVRVSPELEAAVAKALAKEPDQRFQSMTDLGAALLATPEGRALSASGKLSPSLERLSSAPPPREQSGTPTSLQFSRPDPNADTHPSDPDRQNPAVPAVTSVAPQRSEAETQLAPPARPSKAPWIALGAIVMLGGAGVFFWRFAAETPRPATSASATETTAPSAAPTPMTSASAPVVAPTDSAPPADPKVKLAVETTPPKAILYLNGAQVCDETPCEVEVDDNQTVELEAKLGGRSGKTKVLAQRDQKVPIRLAAPHVAPPPTRPNAQPCYAEVIDENGLKTLKPVPCKH